MERTTSHARDLFLVILQIQCQKLFAVAILVGVRWLVVSDDEGGLTMAFFSCVISSTGGR